jgi:uncharacterized protein (DUF433 family)
MTSIPTDIKRIVRTPGVYGDKPCIEGHRNAVHDIAESFNLDLTPKRIMVEHYPTLSLTQVYAALLYYHEHQVEIDREIIEEAADVKARGRADTSTIAQRMRERVRQRKEELKRQAGA